MHLLYAYTFGEIGPPFAFSLTSSLASSRTSRIDMLGFGCLDRSAAGEEFGQPAKGPVRAGRAHRGRAPCAVPSTTCWWSTLVVAPRISACSNSVRKAAAPTRPATCRLPDQPPMRCSVPRSSPRQKGLLLSCRSLALIPPFEPDLVKWSGLDCQDTSSRCRPSKAGASFRRCARYRAPNTGPSRSRRASPTPR
jgi:hypothetical protein